LEQTIKQYEASARAQLGEKQRRKRDTILEEIRNVINAKAKAGSYTLVVDSAAESINSTPVILYSTGENDLTEAILNELNSTAPPGVIKALDERKAKEDAEKKAKEDKKDEKK
jgi:Skp family chaperone for outer membrane proteins